MNIRPKPGLMLQDPRGERWIVTYVDHRSVTLCAVHDNPRYHQPDPTYLVQRKQWPLLFPQGWLTI